MTNSKFVFLIILIGLVSSLAGLYLGKNTLFFNNATQTEVFFNSQSKDLNNNNVSLSQYKNKWLLVNFWAIHGGVLAIGASTKINGFVAFYE